VTTAKVRGRTLAGPGTRDRTRNVRWQSKE
jgi:hypothetical protein